jgi:hypothetical protein
VCVCVFLKINPSVSREAGVRKHRNDDLLVATPHLIYSINQQSETHQ